MRRRFLSSTGSANSFQHCSSLLFSSFQRVEPNESSFFSVLRYHTDKCKWLSLMRGFHVKRKQHRLICPLPGLLVFLSMTRCTLIVAQLCFCVLRTFLFRCVERLAAALFRYLE